MDGETTTEQFMKIFRQLSDEDKAYALEHLLQMVAAHDREQSASEEA